jgi:hypothetical protein
VEVLGAVDEVVGGEQDLGADEAVPGQGGAEPFHEPGLAHRGDGLQRADVGGALGQPERGHAGGDRSGGDEHDLVALGAGRGDLAAELGDGRLVDVAGGVGEGRRPDLDDCDHRGRFDLRWGCSGSPV